MSCEVSVTQGNKTLFRATCDVKSDIKGNSDAAGGAASSAASVANGNPYTASLTIFREMQAKATAFLSEAAAVAAAQGSAASAVVRRNRGELGGGDDESDESDG